MIKYGRGSQQRQRKCFFSAYRQSKIFKNVLSTQIFRCDEDRNLGCAGQVQDSKKVLALIRYMTEDNSIGNSFGNSTVSEGSDFRGHCWQQCIIF